MKRRLSLRARCSLGLGALGLASILGIPALAAPPANDDRGLESAPAINYSGLDQVNLFNGGLSISIPLGPRFPLGPGTDYGFSLQYSSQLWDGQSVDDQGSHNPWQVNPSKTFNAGLGWRVSLGMLLPPNDIASGWWNWTFISPDGSQHRFSDRLHPADPLEAGTLYATDGSYLRFSVAGKRVDTPSGLSYFFQATAPYRLEKIEDPFGNRVTLDYSQLSSQGFVKVFDYHGREHRMHFNLSAAEGAYYGARGVLTQLELSKPSPTAPGNIWTFSYGRYSTARGCPHQHTQQFPQQVYLPFLTRVSQPDGTTWELDFQQGAYDTVTGNTCSNASGLVRKLRLPTFGQVEWDYGYISWPVENANRCIDFGYSTVGVATRRLVGYPENNPAVVDAQTDYVRAWANDWDCAPPITNLPDWSSTEVIEKVRQQGQLQLARRSRNYFQLDFQNGGYGLPGRPDQPRGAGLLSTEIWNPTGGKVRSVYLAHLNDATLGSEPWNPLPWYQLTLFEDDKVNGEVAQEEKIWGGHDGLGHFESLVTSNNFGNHLAAELGGLPPGFAVASGRSESTDYYPRPTPSQPWVLHRVKHSEVIEGGFRQRVEQCHDADGFLRWQRTYANGSSPGPNDALSRFTRGVGGFLAKEEYFGAESNPLTSVQANPSDCSLSGLPATNTYERQHTYAFGALATTTDYLANGTAMPFKAVDRTIDPSTGRPTQARDVAGLATGYVFDELGRLRSVQPPGEAAATVYRYGIGSLVQSPSVEVAKVHGGVDLELTRQELGRFGQAIAVRTLMPRGSGVDDSTVNIDTNLLGWKVNESLPRWSGDPRKDTQYRDYDAFGRPRKIIPPEGAQHETTIAYWGERRLRRTSFVGLEGSTPGGLVETPITNEEIYDGQRRLVMVREHLVGPGQFASTTTYGYDAANRLISVNQQTASGVQSRSFEYDGLGNLVRETHPEKSGPVTYGGYDAWGNPGWKKDGGVELHYRYDRAGRLTQVRAGSASGEVLKEFVYGTANAGTNYKKGKLERATRFNRVDVALPSQPPSEETVTVQEIYTYQGLGGRLSNRRTQVTIGSTGQVQHFDAGYRYEPGGRVDLLYYPFCGNCSLGFSYSQGAQPRGLALAFPFPGSPQSWSEQFQYHPTGGLAEIRRSNDTVDTVTLDPTNPSRPASLSAATDLGVPLWNSGAYSYDGSGNILGIGGSLFRYDGFRRLTLAQIKPTPFSTGAAQEQRFTYDGFGNLTAIAGAQGLNIPTNAETNRLSSAGSLYDARGNLTQWNGANYTYDAFDRMVRHRNGGEDWAYFYTADDERILARKLGGTKHQRWTARGTDHQVLGSFLEQETSPGQTTWTEEAYYIRLGSQLISAITDEGVRHFHLDHLGTPRLVTDSSGTPVAFHAYFPYGGEATAASQTDERLKFTGHERDLLNPNGTGDDLDYMHARHHSPILGRFLGVDPKMESAQLGQPQSWNRYNYSYGNPLRWIDENGGVPSTPKTMVVGRFMFHFDPLNHGSRGGEPHIDISINQGGQWVKVGRVRLDLSPIEHGKKGASKVPKSALKLLSKVGRGAGWLGVVVSFIDADEVNADDEASAIQEALEVRRGIAQELFGVNDLTSLTDEQRQEVERVDLERRQESQAAQRDRRAEERAESFFSSLCTGTNACPE